MTAIGRRPKLDAVPVAERQPERRARRRERDRLPRRRQPAGPDDALLRARPAAARRAHRRPRHRLPARHDDGRPAGLERCAQTPPATSPYEWRLDEHRRDQRRPRHCRGHRRRPRLDRRRDGPQARPHDLLVDHPRVRGLRLRHLRRRRPPALRVVAVDAAAVGPDPRLHRAASTAASPRSATSGGPATSSSTTTPTTAPPTSRTSAFVVPIFHGGELVGFSATTAHHLDLGALTPGTLRDRRRHRRLRRGSAAQRDQDRGGGPQQRVRSGGSCATTAAPPQLVVGDMEAQVAAAPHRGRALPRAGRPLRHRDRAGAASEDLMDYSERMLRAEIERLPDGTYAAEGFDRRVPRPPGPALPGPAHRGRGDGRAARTSTSTSPAPRSRSTCRSTCRSTARSTSRSDRRCARSSSTRPRTRPCRPTRASSARSPSSAPEGSLANPRFPAPDDRPLLPRQRPRGHAHAGARPDRPGPRQRRASGNLKVVAYSGLLPSGGALGLHGHPGGQLRRPARQGRPRRGRHPLREHAQQPDRGHRVPLPAPGHPLRAARGLRRARAAGAGGLGTVREIEFLDAGGFSLEGDGSSTRRRACSAARTARRGRCC